MILKRAAALFLVASLAACSGAQVKPAEVNPTDMPKGPGLFSGKSGNILDVFRANHGEVGETARLGVNSFLWRASLETVSFMPIAHEDSTGGVITTDWYTNPNKPNERVKVNIFIFGKVLRADALRVSMFKQTKGSGGNWLDQPSDPATDRQLEDIILTKARSLRVAAQANQ